VQATADAAKQRVGARRAQANSEFKGSRSAACTKSATRKGRPHLALRGDGHADEAVAARAAAVAVRCSARAPRKALVEHRRRLALARDAPLVRACARTLTVSCAIVSNRQQDYLKVLTARAPQEQIIVQYCTGTCNCCVQKRSRTNDASTRRVRSHVQPRRTGAAWPQRLARRGTPASERLPPAAVRCSRRIRQALAPRVTSGAPVPLRSAPLAAAAPPQQVVH
jgi:hypothetical protein